MTRTETKEKKPLLLRVLNLLLVLMLLVTAGSGAWMAARLHRAYTRDPYGSIQYCAKNGEFSDMVRVFRRNHYDVDPFRSPYEEEYHLADYADAAFQLRYFETVGDEPMAQRLRERMEAARAQIELLAPVLGQIDRTLDEGPYHDYRMAKS